MPLRCGSDLAHLKVGPPKAGASYPHSKRFATSLVLDSPCGSGHIEMEKAFACHLNNAMISLFIFFALSAFFVV